MFLVTKVAVSRYKIMNFNLFAFLLFSIFQFNRGTEYLENCGISEVSLGRERIIGGRNAKPGEFPWQVSLKLSNIFIAPTHLCGGTILNVHWIITAAHCVHKRSEENFLVVAGIISQIEENYTSYAVDKMIVHEKFDPETFLNDIALIRLKEPLHLSSQVNSICLPSAKQNTTGFATATGWGATVEDGDMSPILQAVDLQLIPSSFCELIYSSDYFSTLAMICAGDLGGGIDSCQGDSGGPLIQRQNGKEVLLGIVSWGVGCALPDLPGVYTRVSNFIDWIENNVD